MMTFRENTDEFDLADFWSIVIAAPMIFRWTHSMRKWRNSISLDLFHLKQSFFVVIFLISSSLPHQGSLVNYDHQFFPFSLQTFFSFCQDSKITSSSPYSVGWVSLWLTNTENELRGGCF